MKRIIQVFFVILSILPPVLKAQTPVPGGEISGTWDLAGSPYQVEGDLTIPNDSTLTIQPGVVVEFQGHYSLIVLGRLLATGTAEDSILFTVNDTTGFSDPGTEAGGWYGIRFNDTPVHNDSSKIIHCCLEYGKAFGPVWHLNAGGAICILQFGKVEISDCLFRYNQALSTTGETPIGGALYLFRSDALIQRNIFHENHAMNGGAVYFDDADPIFKENIFLGNQAEMGGAIAMGEESHPTFSGDRILDNVASSHGGGILFFGSTVVTCTDLTVKGNQAQWGAGIGNMGGTLQAESCLFTGNHAVHWGGGVAGDFATMYFENCRFSNDTSDWGSGGLHMDHASVEIIQCSFEDNRAVFGGGFHTFFSQVHSKGCQFLNNISESGGGIHLENSDCIIENTGFSHNQAFNGPGGAIIYYADSTIFGREYNFLMKGCLIEDNEATQQFGGVGIQQLGSDTSMVKVQVDSCDISGNHSDVYSALRISGYVDDFLVSRTVIRNNTTNRYVPGGGFIDHASGSVMNCIFSCNYSSYSDSTKSARGASLGSEAEVDFINCTFVDTSGTDGVGLNVRMGCSARVINSIFWGWETKPISVTTAGGLGSTLDLSYSDIVNGIDSVYVSDSLSVLNWGEGNISDDPQFVDLSGGDLHLSETSPCIGSGVNVLSAGESVLYAPETDLEGNPRPSPEGSMVDMGALEHMRGYPVGIKSKHIDGIQGIHLYQNHPNPFSGTTVISYQLPVACRVDLSVYNLSGQKVATLVSGIRPEGLHNLEWDGSGMTGGYYFYRLETDRGTAGTKRLILLR